MKIRSATFAASAPDLLSCPQSPLPEFAFIGRSNVGKSSLINMLTGKAGLAKVSATPGKTRLINFFTINNAWSLVDLPGYGFAKVGKSDRADFSRFVAGYLENRANLRGTFVLIDSRLTPQRIDLDFLTWMVGHRLPFALVFTKADKLSAKGLKDNMDAFITCMAEISEELPEIFVSSARLDRGQSDILGMITDVLNEAPANESNGDSEQDSQDDDSTGD